MVNPPSRKRPARSVPLTLFGEQRLDLVQLHLGVQEVRAVDLAHVAAAVDEEHLEHVRELSSIARHAHVLTEALDERHQLARRARSEEIPAQPIALVDRAAAGVLLHYL